MSAALTDDRTLPGGLTAPLDGELKTLLRRLKLGKAVDTLPDRLALAKANKLSHAEFLTLVLADEATRRDATSAQLRARAAHLDPGMRLETFDPDGAARFDREVWTELTSLRMLELARGALVLGPVGVGKTHLASALGHIAIRRRASVAFHRADQLFRSLKAARLDASLPAEMRRLTRVDLLILDDFALQAMDPTATGPLGHGNTPVPSGWQATGRHGVVRAVLHERLGKGSAGPGELSDSRLARTSHRGRRVIVFSPQ